MLSVSYGGVYVAIPPCLVLIPDFLLVSTMTDATGHAEWGSSPSPIPCNLTLLGVQLFVQWYTVSPGVEPIPGTPVSLSNIRRLTIGL